MSESRIRLLVVEDDKVDRMAFERIVKAEKLPYDYTCASSLKEAKEFLKSRDFDVVVTDFNLGDGSGFDLFPEAIACGTPIVLVTGAGGEETAVQAMKSGAADYLIKDPAGSYLKTLPLTVANTIKAKAVERELKDYHEQLKKSKETVEALLNATSDCAFLLKTDGSFVALNQPTAQFLGSQVADLVGRSYFDLIPGELAASRREKFDAVVSTGDAVRFEDKGMDKFLDHSFHPVFGPDGKVDSVAVFSRDITEQKRRQELSVQSQRLAALGEMAGGVAHNFNNVLQIIVGAAGLAEADLDSGDLDEVRATLSQISDSAQFGSETVKQLQDFARVRTENPTAEGKVFDLSVTVGRAADVTRPFWKTGPEKRGVHILLKQELAPNCLVKGKEGELFEVIVNLIKNAAEAMPKGGTLLVKTFVKKGLTHLGVVDTGTGISKENLTKVFEPFWTSKGVQGTGMGLSTSFGIVSRHGGVISVKSKEGKGTAFAVKVPYAGEAAHEQSSQPKLVSEPKFLSGSKGNVLVADAEHMMGAVLEKGLRRWGYSVIESISGKGAIEILRRNRIRLVVTSMELPDMTGLELARSTKDARKGIPLIMLSDPDLTLDDPHSMTDSGVDLVLDKPVKFPLLFSTVRELLEQSKSGPARSAQTAAGTT